MYVNKEFGSEEKPKARKRSVLTDKKNLKKKKKILSYFLIDYSNQIFLSLLLFFSFLMLTLIRNYNFNRI